MDIADVADTEHDQSGHSWTQHSSTLQKVKEWIWLWFVLLKILKALIRSLRPVLFPSEKVFQLHYLSWCLPCTMSAVCSWCTLVDTRKVPPKSDLAGTYKRYNSVGAGWGWIDDNGWRKRVCVNEELFHRRLHKGRYPHLHWTACGPDIRDVWHRVAASRPGSLLVLIPVTTGRPGWWSLSWTRYMRCVTSSSNHETSLSPPSNHEAPSRPGWRSLSSCELM